ncbi:hypothetical protein [Yersinia ruckeri]|uniref:hypothetical protein n=1 Tax=Yersinia ruckeri TaxID=29486 RepID=UPI0022381885|nr:hypothetical protein [Yersinia ruckeri]MCW6598837.1 hypothetical protein [Yersinia ruckeri]
MATELNPSIFGASLFSGNPIIARGNFNFEEVSRTMDAEDATFLSDGLLVGRPFGISSILTATNIAESVVQSKINAVSRTSEKAYFELNSGGTIGSVFSDKPISVGDSLIDPSINVNSSKVVQDRIPKTTAFAVNQLAEGWVFSDTPFRASEWNAPAENKVNVSKSIDKTLPKSAIFEGVSAVGFSTVFNSPVTITGDSLIDAQLNLIPHVSDFDRLPKTSSLQEAIKANSAIVFDSLGMFAGESLIDIGLNVKSNIAEFEHKPVQSPLEAAIRSSAVIFDGKGMLTGKSLIDKGLNTKSIKVAREVEVNKLSIDDAPTITFSRLFGQKGFITGTSLIAEQVTVPSREMDLQRNPQSINYPANQNPPYQVFSLAKNSVVDSEKDPFVFKGVLPSDSGIHGFITGDYMDSDIQSGRTIFELPSIMTGTDIPVNFTEISRQQVIGNMPPPIEGVVLSMIGDGVMTMKTSDATVVNLFGGFYALSMDQATVFKYEAPEQSEQFWV